MPQNPKTLIVITPKDTKPTCLLRNFDAFIDNRKKLFIFGLCIISAVRIFFFCTAFPFFNNVDEIDHFDTVVKYSHGHFPRQDNLVFCDESVKSIAYYGSLEYFYEPSESTTLPPPWLLGDDVASVIVSQMESKISSKENTEMYTPSVYYVITGMWYNIGKQLGFNNGILLYWIRFLNIGIFTGLLILSYLYCRDTISGSSTTQTGVLLLLAFFPQDLFYSITNDVLSPLFFLASLYFLYQIYSGSKNRLYYFVTGLVIAMTYLSKISNLPIWAVFVTFLFLWIRKIRKQADFKNLLSHLFLLILGAVLPAILWHGWSFYALNDLVGTTRKIEFLGWTPKRWTEIWNHPIFTLHGIIYFLSELLKTFWRGEIVWKMTPVASHGMDLFYVLSSFLFLPVGIWASRSRQKKIGAFYPPIWLLSVLAIFSSILLLGILSTHYDFGECPYPSSQRPYFTSGRLISGILIPFLILYVEGLNYIVSKITRHISPIFVVLLIALLIFVSEIVITLPVLRSPYNWFHLP